MCASAPIQSQILPILSQGEQAWLLFAVLELHVCVCVCPTHSLGACTLLNGIDHGSVYFFLGTGWQAT